MADHINPADLDSHRPIQSSGAFKICRVLVGINHKAAVNKFHVLCQHARTFLPVFEERKSQLKIAKKSKFCFFF